MEQLVGKTLGPYQINELIGKGGMAAVYLALQPSMNRNVAVKVMAQQFTSEDVFVARFKNEAQLIAQLEHAHILPVYDFGEQEGTLYIVMRYLASGSLEDRVQEGGMDLKQAQQIFNQIASALDYAHSRGVIHRDLKPANVMLDEQGNAFLTDFGIAKSLEADQGLTATDSVVGTPIYMAPEQGLGEGVDNRSDIYALGVMLYEMLTGSPPFNADNPMAVMLKHINDDPPPPTQFNPALPTEINAVVLKALEKEPEDRYASCQELGEALAEAVANATGSAPAPPVPTVEIPSGGFNVAAGSADPTVPSPVASGGVPTNVAGYAASAGAAGIAAAPTPVLTKQIEIKFSPLSKWIYNNERLFVWVQAFALSLVTLIALLRLTNGGVAEAIFLSVIPGILLYGLLRAPTVGALVSFVLILVPLAVHAPGLGIIWAIVTIVAGSRLTSREMMLILVTMIAAGHPIGILLPLATPWWFRSRRAVLSAAMGVLLAIFFAATLSWPNAAGLLPTPEESTMFDEVILSDFDQSYLGLFDSALWEGLASDSAGLLQSIFSTFRLFGDFLSETNGLLVILPAVWALATVLSISNRRSEETYLRAIGIGLGAIVLFAAHTFNSVTSPQVSAYIFFFVAVLLALALTQFPVQIDPNQGNKIGTTLRMLRQTLGALFVALGVAFFANVLGESTFYFVFWILGLFGVIAMITNPFIGPPLVFLGIIVGFVGADRNVAAAILAVLLFVYLGVNFFLDSRRPRRWNPLGAGLILGAPGLSGAGMLPVGVLSIGALEAQVPATILASIAHVVLIVTAADMTGGSATPLSVIIQLLTTIAGVLVVERLMSLTLLEDIDHKLRRLIFTVVLSLVMGIGYYVLGRAVLNVSPVQAILFGAVTAAILVASMGERARFWRRFIEREEEEEDLLEDDELTSEFLRT